jgi:hypothetical protein
LRGVDKHGRIKTVACKRHRVEFHGVITHKTGPALANPIV